MSLMNLNTSENVMTHRLKLRSYQKEDAELICKWLRTEEELYRWSADRFNRYPLTGLISMRTMRLSLQLGDSIR